ncbi:hypothetical protein PMO31116_00808 [Pandoraea morbifera]|uniref:Type III secretion system subunit n=1 Tax=Pandoraea morbifera TaxID=2508300 RepID=A0A5E4SJ16_9BURK|nr:type III secretion system domain-containing protein [Pandoraea morbifera]VVD75285.1 hypothetical protein PMO31116_00808 [Pandoraea morbifera]
MRVHGETAAAQLARLIWQPGGQMDDGWWHAFGMTPWRDAYRRHAACRASIDAQLVVRRGWPAVREVLGAHMVPPCSEAAQARLRRLPTLRRVAVAYGLRTMGCPDYLLLGAYRRALSPWLDAWQCDRLLLTRAEWPARVSRSPDAIVVAAMARTGRCLDAIAMPEAADLATIVTAARILLPPAHDTAEPDGAVSEGASDVDMWGRLAALERMLCMSSKSH